MGIQHQHHQGELPETGKPSFTCNIRKQHLLNNSHNIVVGFHYHQAEEGQIWSEFYTLMSNESQKFNIDQIKNAEIKLQLILLQDKGSGALSPDKAQHVRVLLPLTAIELSPS